MSRGFVLAVDGGLPVLQVPPPAIIPDATRITRAQGKSQLVTVDLFSVAKTWVDSEETPEMVRIGFYDQTHWVITDPFIQLAKEKLGLSDEELQQLFNEAAKI